MSETVEIRESGQDDLDAIDNLYPDAFPEEDLLPLVSALLREPSGVLSLVALFDGSVVGHAIFTRCGVAERTDQVALLAPLAVATIWQRQGIGGKIVQAGLRRLKKAGLSKVFVLGDPDYYGRFGFEPETDIVPPYPLPQEWRGAWQGLTLRKTEPPLFGQLSVPKPWLRSSLWAP